MTYSTLVSFVGDPAAAFQLLKIRDVNGPITTPRAVGLTATVLNATGVTVVTLTFIGSETDPLSLDSGSVGVPGPSLADGLYQLITGNYATPADGSAPGLYRLFGDINGNGVNNACDFAQFRLAYGSSSTDPAYQAAFDEDANGAINAFDYAQFRLRYGDNVLP